MASIRSKLFVFALRHHHWLKGRWRRRAFVDWDTSIPALRREAESRSGAFGKLRAGFRVDPVSIGGLHGEWLHPPQAAAGKALLYFHGGGYVLGSAETHRGIVAKPAGGSGVSALTIDYRLAPEHPFPAALEDAVAAYAWLLAAGFDAADIVCMGDSAGAGLCLALLLALREAGLPFPAGAIALSPWTDLKNTAPSYEENAARDSLCWREAQTIFSAYYTAGQDAGNPLISPLYGDLAGLPPLLIFAGGDELMRDDATRFAEKAAAEGVAVDLVVGPGLFHCYPVCSPLFPEAKQAMESICAFIRNRLGIA